MAAGRFACTQVLSHIVRGSNSLLSKSRSALPQQKRLISLASQAYQRYFTKDHEWIDVEGNVGTVGITDHAQAALGELVYVELPEVEDSFDQDDSVGAVESVKAASDVMTPVSGTIVAVNEDLTANPSLINKNAESDAWMFKIELSDADELSEMLDAAGYKAFVDAESG
ncbi:glycine cleavage system H protein-like [Clytia hemisphaerica]|uniref:Glycine cleavage system H protein n=1 Tax=Clytia hemisphaerica TaxID=252671 RepID=A0A7M5XMK7_9CNID|eukprot:TCONS_00061290-protein